MIVTETGGTAELYRLTVVSRYLTIALSLYLKSGYLAIRLSGYPDYRIIGSSV
jgi:hypothetical protein